MSPPRNKRHSLPQNIGARGRFHLSVSMGHNISTRGRRAGSPEPRSVCSQVKGLSVPMIIGPRRTYRHVVLSPGRALGRAPALRETRTCIVSGPIPELHPVISVRRFRVRSLKRHNGNGKRTQFHRVAFETRYSRRISRGSDIHRLHLRAALNLWKCNTDRSISLID